MLHVSLLPRGARELYKAQMVSVRARTCHVGPDIKVEFPPDPRVRFLIDSLASYVVSDGCSFEMAAMSTQGTNPEFAFLFDLRSSEHAYYR